MPDPLRKSFELLRCSCVIVVFACTANLSAEDANTIELHDATNSRCIEVLRAGLKSDEFWPSMHAAEALTLAGYGAEVREQILPLLQFDRDAQHRCGIARELVRAGDRKQVAVMLDVLADRDTYGHTHACESLYKVAEIGDGQLVRAAFREGHDIKTRLMAAAALGRCGNIEAIEFVRGYVADPNLDTAKIAAWILGVIGDQRDLPALRQGASKATDPLARAYFENALALLGDPAGAAALQKNLTSDDTAVRTYAANFAGDARAISAKSELIKLLDDANLDVRVRAAQSLLTLSQTPVDASDEIIVRDVYTATAENPRYSEGSIVVLGDGRLLYAVTEFIADDSDFAKAQIIARESSDGGRTWSEPRVLQENVGKNNVMSVTLRYLDEPARESTPLGMFYLVKNGFDDLDVFLRISTDDGRTFGEPVLVTDRPGYHVMNNDRVTRLSSGRLLAPVASTPDVEHNGHFVSYCFLSDDAGKTWRPGSGQVDVPKRGAMEPEVLELTDGRVLMLIRTQLGHIAVSHSSDGGDTWSEPASWNVRSPESPATLRRIPATGDLLLIWNDSESNSRTPLTAAISRDEGKTWEPARNIESHQEENYAYTSLNFRADRVLMSYYVRDGKTGRISSRFRSMPLSWFYGADPSAN